MKDPTGHEVHWNPGDPPDDDYDDPDEDDDFDGENEDAEPEPEVTQEEYEDAVIEDTVHCGLCNVSMCCGDSDLLIDDGSGTEGPPVGWCLCMSCAKSVHDQYRSACKEMGEES